MNTALRLNVSEKKADINSDVIAMSKLSFFKGIKPILFDWTVILTTIYVAQIFSSLWTYLAAIVVIASRQHALLVVVHDAAHFRLSKKHGVNDFISNVFAAFPALFCTAGYRANHMKHHRHLNTMEDPDWARKIHLPEWQFPQSKMSLSKVFIKMAFTGWFKMLAVFIFLSGLISKKTYTTREGQLLLAQKVLFYSVIATSIYYLGLGSLVLKYWLVPFFFVLPLIERVRSISEHFALSYADEFNQTRNILCSPIEAFMFGPHNIRYHLVHHLYPSVPQYNLPEMYERLMQETDFATKSHTNDSYFILGQYSVLHDLLTKNGKSYE